MNCHEAREWLDAYTDGELDLPRSLELETHLRDCAACAQAKKNLATLREGVRAAAFDAPAALRRRVRDAVRPRVKARRVPWFIGSFGAAAAALLLGLLLAPTVFQSSADRRRLEEITDSHLRSLIAGHPVDVVSSDQHTVRPWFEGKIDFAPPVPDLSANGFEIVGGRLDYLAGRPAATLVYQARKHYLSVFIQPAASAQATEIASLPEQRGYRVVRWTANGMSCWAISEINADELRDFAKAFRAQTDERGN